VPVSKLFFQKTQTFQFSKHPAMFMQGSCVILVLQNRSD